MAYDPRDPRDPDRTVVMRDEAAPAGPPPGPPRGWLAWENPWPWLAALGLLVVAGLLVWLLVFNKSNRATVPAVVGSKDTVAVKQLNDAGFNVKEIRGPSAKPLAIVVSQEPGGGTQLKKNETVVIHVSNGQKPVSTTTTTTPTTTTATTTAATTSASPPTVAMPDVVGKQQADGAGAVEAAGLVADTFAAKSSQPAGTITAETPSAGTQVKAGESVKLTVSSGSTTPGSQSVPNVVGKKASDARTALWTAGFTVKTTYKSGQAGEVVSQQPAGGASAPGYSQVTLVVGR